MIIGLLGFIGSGKGTAADILVEKHGFHKISFADSVKDAVSVIFGWPRHLLEGDTDESRKFRECPDPYWSEKFGRSFTPREALQKMGTEAGRDVFDQNLWIYSIEKKVQSHDNVVIPDVRFPNEIKFIRDLGGHIVRVKRGNDPEWYNDAFCQNMGHIPTAKNVMEKYWPNIHYSEWAWIGTNLDYLLHNEGTPYELEVNMRFALTLFQGPCKISA